MTLNLMEANKTCLHSNEVIQRPCGSSPCSTVAKRRQERKEMVEEDKRKEQGMSFLDDFVDNHDAESVLMLAECCALGRGIKQNPDNAMMLVSESARMGNREAQSLMSLLGKWKGRDCVEWRRL